MEKRRLNTSITVIVPIYNVEEYLSECLNSLENQTFDDFEVILINDGSTDKSGIIAQEYAECHDRFRLINRVNGGLSAARNTGICEAQGEYIYFLDSDDFIANDTLEKLYKRAKRDNLDLLRFSAYIFEDGTNDYLWTRESARGGYKYLGDYPDVMNGRDFFRKIIINNDFYPSCCLIFIKREVIEKFNLRFYEGILHEDNIFNFNLTNLCDRVGVLNEPLYYRRYRIGSIMTTNNWVKKMESMCISAVELDKLVESRRDTYLPQAEWLMNIFINNMFLYWEKIPYKENSKEIRNLFTRVKPFLKKYNIKDFSIRLYFYNYFLFRLFKILNRFRKS